MTTFSNRIIICFFSMALLVAVAIATVYHQLYFLLLPFGLLTGFYLLQNPVYLFYTLLAAIPWSIEYSFNDRLGTDLPDEPLMLLLSAAAIIWLIYNRDSISRNRHLHPLIWIIILQLAWTVITVMTSTDPIASVKYLLAKSWYLLAFLAAPLILFRDSKILKRSACILVASMLAVMLATFFRHAENGLTFEKINASLQPFYHNHVNYSALLVFMVPVQVAIIRLSTRKSFVRFLFIMLAITVAALYFSYSRGAWLALVMGLLTYWLIRKRILVLVFILLFTCCLGGVAWLQADDHYLAFSNDYKTTIFHKDFQQHLIATYKLKDVSTAERFYRWVAGARMVKDSWKTGFGPTTFYKNYRSYIIPAFRTWVSDNKEHSTVHNYFLLMIIEQGVIGLLLFLFLLGSLFWYAQAIYNRTKDRFWKIITAASASVLMMVCTIIFLSDMIETDKVGSVFYLCVAIIITADIQTKRETSGPSPHVQRIA